jgi:hypothetical protein
MNVTKILAIFNLIFTSQRQPTRKVYLIIGITHKCPLSTRFGQFVPKCRHNPDHKTNWSFLQPRMAARSSHRGHESVEDQQAPHSWNLSDQVKIYLHFNFCHTDFHANQRRILRHINDIYWGNLGVTVIITASWLSLGTREVHPPVMQA